MYPYILMKHEALNFGYDPKSQDGEVSTGGIAMDFLRKYINYKFCRRGYIKKD